MKTGIAIFFACLLCYGSPSFASDAFTGIKCGSDIPSALIGKHDSNDTVVKIEARHKDLGLKDLGADEISEDLNSINWMICGSEYMLLEDKKSLIHDVIQVPDHAKHALTYTGICKINGKDNPDFIFAILNDEEGKKMLTASAAWVIDQKARKFKKIDTEGMVCPRE